MQVGQLAVGIGIGLGLAVGTVGGWTAFQRLQAGNSAVAQSAIQSLDQSVAQPVTQPIAQPVTQPIAQPVAQTVSLTQAENDYLYDLSVALQPAEQRRLSDAEKLAMGRQIAGWLQQGQDYWGVRSQFDQLYRPLLAGDYGHNRDVYIKFATERLAPAFVATLTPPPEVIVKTRTRYVETPGRTQVVQVPGPTKVIREVVQVPEPFPVPQPWPVPPHRPHHPHHPYPDDQTPDEPSNPDHPDIHVGQPEPDQPQAELPNLDSPEPGSPDLDSPNLDAEEEVAAEPSEQDEAPEQPASRPETLEVSAELSPESAISRQDQ